MNITPHPGPPRAYRVDWRKRGGASIDWHESGRFTDRDGAARFIDWQAVQPTNADIEWRIVPVDPIGEVGVANIASNLTPQAREYITAWLADSDRRRARRERRRNRGA